MELATLPLTLQACMTQVMHDKQYQCSPHIQSPEARHLQPRVAFLSGGHPMVQPPVACTCCVVYGIQRDVLPAGPAPRGWIWTVQDKLA